MKIVMIRMSKHPVSMLYCNTVLPSWKQHGYDVEFFEAITPANMHLYNEIKFGRKLAGRTKQFSDTEKAVWHSHFQIWKRCALGGEPYIVIEHDSMLIKPLPKNFLEPIKLLSFSSISWKQNKKVLTPGSGYYITPLAATALYGQATIQPIYKNSDGYICDVAGPSKVKKMDDHYYIEQISIDGLNTIDHGKNPYRIFNDPNDKVIL